MNLNKSAFSTLCLAFALSACSGGDGFGVGNSSDGIGGSSSEEDSTVVTDNNITVRIGNGSGASFVQGVIDADDTDLEAFGSTDVYVTLVDDSNNLYLGEVTAQFSSDCISRGLASMNPEQPKFVSGAINATYTADGCSGTDTLYANVALGSNEGAAAQLFATVPISVASLALGTGSGTGYTDGVISTTADGSTLSYGGDAAVSVNIVNTNDNSLFGNSVTVDFTSLCSQRGEATIDSSVNTKTGTATAKYSAGTCVGEDTITASIGSEIEATATIDIANQRLGSLEFVSADPTTIALKGSGSGSHPEVSTITFSVKDEVGEPMAGETVTYSLTTEVGGISLANTSSVTDSEGNTTVQLSSGGVNGPVSVIAEVTVTYDDGSQDTKNTTSDPIAILGGLPDNDSFSLSANVLNPWAGVSSDGSTHDGEQVVITIRAADRYNNDARDGTRVSFHTSGGSIVGSCELANGACSVNWTGQDPRPADGVATILARTTGEESFIEENYDGVYDIGETIVTGLGEAFNDYNRNGIRDAGEYYSDFNNNGQYDQKTGSLFQGTNCSTAAEAAGHCANLVEVRRSLSLSMSSGEVNMSIAEGSFIDVSSEPVSVNFTATDTNGNSPPNGTQFELSASKITVTNQEIVLPNSRGALQQELILDPNYLDADTVGTITIKATSPSGAIYYHSFTTCENGVAGGGNACN